MTRNPDSPMLDDVVFASSFESSTAASTMPYRVTDDG
jgi:hypothetical protein